MALSWQQIVMAKVGAVKLILERSPPLTVDKSISLKTPEKGEEKAHSCETASIVSFDNESMGLDRCHSQSLVHVPFFKMNNAHQQVCPRAMFGCFV